LKKATEPSLLERQNWYNLDISDDSIPGMSVDKAYNELLKGLKADTVIVAVIDTGIDIYHEDLQGLIWVNRDEIPNNGRMMIIMDMLMIFMAGIIWKTHMMRP
jgi:subtilisin family serine protease